MASPKDYFQLHFIVLLWGFTAILGLLISLPPVEIVFYRTLMSFLGLGLIIYFRRIKFNWDKREVLKILGNGALISAHWILFFLSARVSTVSVCLAGMATLALWTSMIEPIAYRRSIKWYEVFLSFLVIIGLYLIFRFEFGYALGLTLAVLSAFLAAVFSVINSKLVKNHDPYYINFLEMIGAFLFTLLFLPVYQVYFSSTDDIKLSPNTYDWIYLGVLAWICTVYAYTIGIELLRKLSAFAINLTVNLEPVYGIILALIIFGEKERMSEGFYWGTLTILISVFLHPILDKYYHQRLIKSDKLL